MQLFYAPELDPDAGSYVFSEEESKHCVRVLRLGAGDSLHLTDGRGTMCRAEIVEASPKHCRVVIRERWPEFEKRGYELVMAVAPTKNTDRFEWFAEKATEIGVDRIVPLLTDHCERRTLKTDRLEKVVTSAVKQSLKAYHPVVEPLTPLREWGRTAVRRGEADRPLRKGYAAPFYRATHLSGKPCDGADRARRRFFARRDRISPSAWVCRYLFGA